jgi:hypothetical protein
MVMPAEEFCGHHGLPNWAICVRSRHHERSILWSADSAGRRVILAHLSIRYAEMITRISTGDAQIGTFRGALVVGRTRALGGSS